MNWNKWFRQRRLRPRYCVWCLKPFNNRNALVDHLKVCKVRKHEPNKPLKMA